MASGANGRDGGEKQGHGVGSRRDWMNDSQASDSQTSDSQTSNSRTSDGATGQCATDHEVAARAMR
jgi:hypothetical protein